MGKIEDRKINVVGGDANNLRDIEVHFPVGGISFISGVSGSGKSSLLKDVLAKEGNLRLKEYLNISQKHLGQPKGKAFISALPATVHVGQHSFRASSRTTVGTASGFLALLRQMFVHWSKPYSDVTGLEVASPNAVDYVEWLIKNQKGKFSIWAIPVNYKSDDGVEAALRLNDAGIVSVIVRSESDSPKAWESGREIKTRDFKPLSKISRHIIEANIGTIDLKKDSYETVFKIISLAFEVGRGNVLVDFEDNDNPELITETGSYLDSRYHWVTPDDKSVYKKPDHHLLSFNSPEHHDSGACPQCRGSGESTCVNIDKLVSEPNKSMHQGALAIWTKKNYKYLNIQHETIEGLRGIEDFSPEVPWKNLSNGAKNLVLFGSDTTLVADVDTNTGKIISKPRRFPGFVKRILEVSAKKTKTSEHLDFLVSQGSCNSCNGTRWSHAAKSLVLSGKKIHELLHMSFGEIIRQNKENVLFLGDFPEEGSPYLKQLLQLSKSFVDAGLSHLSAERSMLNISEGESRRIRLASVFDGRHEGLCLLLDEPARGLHDQDVKRLAGSLTKLKGVHTLIVNEHRRNLAKAADHFIQIGPEAGNQGGRITYQGEVPDSWWKKDKKMSRLLSPVTKDQEWLRFYNATHNNLKGIDVSLPLGKLICISGVSGSGKSSFVNGVLKKILNNGEVGGHTICQRVEGKDKVGAVVTLGQNTPQANRRSTVATFLDLATQVRNYYGKLPASKSAGLVASDYGFNSGRGRCSRCLGLGETQDGDLWVTCASCGGLRFENFILTIQADGLNLADFWDLSINDLYELKSSALKDYHQLLESIIALGLGHLSLGRRLDTLSGGEVQRLRIAKQLDDNEGNNILYILDEPAAGLHKRDIVSLMRSIDHIWAAGANTVVLVEHNLDVISMADWVIEFGPGSGPDGGHVVAAGSPDEILRTDTATGEMLRIQNEDHKKIGNISTEFRRPTPAVNEESGEATRRWLKRILGDDIAAIKTSSSIEKSCPTVIFNINKKIKQRLLEYGGLGRDLTIYMMEQQELRHKQSNVEYFLDQWEKNPDAELFIHPYLQEIYIWGIKVPRSILNLRAEQLNKSDFIWKENSDFKRVRVKSNQFSCAKNQDRGVRRNRVSTALAIGSGYVELHDLNEKVIGSISNRLVDIERIIVGPQEMSQYDLLPNSKRGMCNTCKGEGLLESMNLKLIFANTKLPITNPEIFTDEALSILKGVHRNTLVPFFKRLDKEGIWEIDKSLDEFNLEQINIFLYGYWCRPSHGSFLKNIKSNPSEVSSWLRWDGLMSYIMENSNRGDKNWQKIIKESMQLTSCKVCEGSGLQPFSELLSFSKYNYKEWFLNGTVTELLNALEIIDPINNRTNHRRDRLLKICKGLLKKNEQPMKISSLINESNYKKIIPCMVENYTLMPTFLVEKNGNE